MSLSKLVDMELDDEDKMDFCAPIACDTPDYPYGLRISLTEKEMDKLGMKLPEVGEYIDMRVFTCVKSVSCDDREGGKSSRVELQIEKIAVGGYEDDTKSASEPRRRRLYNRST